MKTFQEFLDEAVDPLENKMSGGRGDNPLNTGVKVIDDAHQITDHLKPQVANTADFVKKIKPKVDPSYKQNSSNVPANDGTKKADVVAGPGVQKK